MKFKEKILLAIAAMMLIASSSYLFFYEQWKFKTSNAENRLGLVGKKVNSLKRKSPDSLVWEEIEDAKEIFAGDKVFTPAESSATLKIGDSSIIEMSSMTLIQLTQSKNREISIELEDGSVNANLKKSDGIKSIQSAGASLELNSDSSNVSLDSDKRSGLFSVLSGAVIITKADKKIEMKQNEALKVGPDSAELKKSMLNFRPLSPDLNSLVTQDQLKNLTFSWKTLKNEAMPKVIQVSRDKDFKKILFSNSTKLDSIVLDISGQGTGLFYWRIGYEDLKNQSPGQKFNVFNHLPPKLFFPSDEQNLPLPFDKSNVDLTFDWEDSQGATFLFEMGLREDKQIKLLISKETKEHKLTIPSLQYGHYWWRVQKRIPGLPALWSLKSKFEILSSDGAVSPSYISPANFKMVGLGEKSIFFKWHGNPNARYLLSISKDADFKNPILQQDVINGTFTWPVTKTGKFFWKVTHQDLKEDTAIWTFTIPSAPVNLKSPNDNSFYNIIRPGDKIIFQWDHPLPEHVSKDTQLYELVISKGTEEISRINSKHLEHSWSPKTAGQYHWRVETTGATSEMRQFRVELEPQPIKPKIKKEMRFKIKQKKGVMIDLYERRSEMLAQIGNPSVTNLSNSETYEVAEVKWDEIADAKEYIFEIYRDSSARELLLKRKTKRSPFFWKKAPQGTFYFRFAYFDKHGRQSPFSELSKLIIEEFNAENQRVQLIYPANKFISRSDRQGFEWQGFEECDNYQLIITGFKKNDIIFQNKTNSLSLLTPLAPGLYRWKIIAYEKGKAVARSEERALKVVDPLKAGQLKNPLNNPNNLNFLKADFLYGNLSSENQVKKSGETFQSTESIPLFPGSYSLSLGQSVGKEEYITSTLAYKNGYNGDISYSEFDFGGNLNWYGINNKDWVFFWGPGMKYSSISFISDTSTKNAGASLNFISLTFQATVMTSFKSFDSWKHILNVQGGYSFLTPKSTAMEINYELRKTRIGLLKPWPSFYEKVFFNIGIGHTSNKVISNGNSLYMKEWHLPFGLGLFHDW